MDRALASETEATIQTVERIKVEPNNSSDDEDWPDMGPLLGDLSNSSRLAYTGPMQNMLFWQHQDLVSALIHLCSRPYFTRAWVVLEVTQAKSLELLCGRHHSSMQEFDRVLDRTELRKHNADTRDARELFNARSETFMTGEDGALFFTGILQTYVRKGCSDPRDRIYACLGDRRLKSLEERMKITSIAPDYTRDTLALAIEVMSYFDRLHEAHAQRLKERGKPERDGHLHSMAIDIFFRTLSDALNLPKTPALFYERVQSYLHWTTESNGEEALIAYGRHVPSLGEALRWFLHPDHEQDRADVQYEMWAV
jgi:hypothetical protein